MTPSSSMSMTTSSSQAQETNRILYQIDCCKASSGKTVSLTKRRIRWRFGSSNDTALSRGATGVDCRGCEHEITFVWSIASGKRLIIHDHKEVHYSHGRRAEGKFSFVWSAGGRMFTLVAYAATPVQKTHRAHGKQFELLIDNMEFDSLPRIYELGTGIQNTSPRISNSHTSRAAFAYPSSSATRNTPSSLERRSVQDDMTWARSVHIMETRRQMNSTAVTGAGPTMRQSSRGIVQPSPRQESSPTNAVVSPPQDLISDFSTLDVPQDLLSDPVPIVHHSLVTPYPPVQQVDEFTPSNAATSYDAIWSSIMDAYDSQGGSTSNSDNYAPQTKTPGPIFSVQQHQQEQVQTSLYIDTSKSTSTPALVSPTEVIDKAMNELCNLDDISQSVFQSYSPTQNSAWEGKENVSLKDLKRDGGKQLKKEVMRTYHAHHNQQQQQQPGSLVVYGQGHGLQQGPPPLSFGYRY